MDKFESNLLNTEESDPKISEPDKPTSEKQKKRENSSNESPHNSRGKRANEKTGKVSNEEPKSPVLDSIKADEVGDPIDDELLDIVNSLLTKGND